MDDSRLETNRRLVLVGLLCLGVALIAWSIKEWVPRLLAEQMVATTSAAMPDESNQSRLDVAFAKAREEMRLDARIEPDRVEHLFPHANIYVTANSEQEAVAQMETFMELLKKEFAKVENGKPSELHVSLTRVARPVPSARTTGAEKWCRWAAAGFSLAGIGCGLVFARRVTTPVRGVADSREASAWTPRSGQLPQGGKFMIGYIIVLLVLVELPRDIPIPLPSPLDGPGGIALVMLVMAIPVAIVAMMTQKLIETFRARNWAQGIATITESRSEIGHRHISEETTQVVNTTEIRYTFEVEGRTIEGDRISIGEQIGNNAEAERLLRQYRVGARVPVYFDRANPSNAVLERDLPAPLAVLIAICVVLLGGGAAVTAAILNPGWVQSTLGHHFPAHAHPVGSIITGLMGVLMLMMAWASRQVAATAAKWPKAKGCVITSRVESYSATNARVTLHEPVVEYSYTVEGHEYRSNRIRHGGKVASSGTQAANTLAAKYPVGSEVVVHYDPANPSNAVIETGAAMIVPAVVLGLVLLGLSYYLGH